MMISEFIGRTGFTPTAEEYAEIEKDYMATDIDKDRFCRKWKRSGGAQKLACQRQKRVEELETQIQKEHDDFNEIKNALQWKIDSLERQLRQATNEKKAFGQILKKTQKEKTEAEYKLNTLKTAYEILQGLAIEPI